MFITDSQSQPGRPSMPWANALQTSSRPYEKPNRPFLSHPRAPDFKPSAEWSIRTWRLCLMPWPILILATIDSLLDRCPKWNPKSRQRSNDGALAEWASAWAPVRLLWMKLSLLFAQTLPQENCLRIRHWKSSFLSPKNIDVKLC